MPNILGSMEYSGAQQSSTVLMSSLFFFFVLGVFRSCKILDEIHCTNFEQKIKRTKHDLIIKLITWMDGKSRDESINSN